MKSPYIPKLHLQAEINETKGVHNFGSPMRIQSMATSPEIPEFKDVMTGLVKEVDSTIKAPDAVLQDAMLGHGADVHDVMIAMSKAEVSLSIASQMTTKVIQAYEKIMQIQV